MITNLSNAPRRPANHIRAIKRALRQRRNSAPDAKSVEAHLQDLLNLEPGELDQLYRSGKIQLRQRILTLPLMVGLLLGWHGSYNRANAINEKQTYKYVSALAYCIHANRNSGTVTAEEALRFVPADLWARLVNDAGLLVVRGLRETEDFLPDPDQDYNLYGFPHLSFEEYFAARYLVDGRSEQERAEMLRRHLHDPRWEEVVLLALGSMSKAEAARFLRSLRLEPEPKPSAYEELLQLKDEMRRDPDLYDEHEIKDFILVHAGDEEKEAIVADFEDDMKHFIQKHGRWLPSPDPLLTRYESLFHRDLLFAVRACEEGIAPDSTLKANLLETLTDIYFYLKHGTYKETYKKLMHESSGEVAASSFSSAIPSLGSYELLRSQIWRVLQGAVGSSLEDVLINRLTQLLQQDDERLIAQVIEALEELKLEGAKLEDAIATLRPRDKGEVHRSDPGTQDTGTHSSKATAALLPLLISRNESIMEAAAKVLRNLGAGKAALKVLLPTLEGGNENDQYFARRAANIVTQWQVSGEWERHPYVKMIMPILVYGNKEAQEAAIGILRQMSLGESDQFDKTLFHNHVNQALNALIQLLSDARSEVRSYVAETLGSISYMISGTDWWVHHILPLLNDEEDSVSASAGEALQNISLGHEDDVVAVLLPLLEDDEGAVRRSAAGAFCHVYLDARAEDVAAALAQLVGDEDDTVRLAVADALSVIGVWNTEVRTALTKLLDDSNERVRISAAYTLLQLGEATEDAMTVIAALLRSSDIETRRNAIMALESDYIRSDYVKSDELIITLLPMLQDDNSTVRRAAVEALGKVKSGKDEVARALLPMLNDEDKDVRASVATALGKLKVEDEGIIRALLATIDDDDPNYGQEKVCSSAIEALISLTGHREDIEAALYHVALTSNWREYEEARYPYNKRAYDAAYAALYALTTPRTQVDQLACQGLGQLSTT